MGFMDILMDFERIYGISNGFGWDLMRFRGISVGCVWNLSDLNGILVGFQWVSVGFRDFTGISNQQSDSDDVGYTVCLKMRYNMVSPGDGNLNQEHDDIPSWVPPLLLGFLAPDGSARTYQ